MMDIHTYTQGRYRKGRFERYGYVVLVGKKKRCARCKRWWYEYLIDQHGICMDCRYRERLNLSPFKR
jgi:hypothetical protein